MREIEVGSVWRARRKGEENRTIRVLAVVREGFETYVQYEVVTDTLGHAPERALRIKVRHDQWRRHYMPIPATVAEPVAS